MKKYFYFSLFILVVFACSKEVQHPHTKAMDELLNRYHDLGRFSGSVLIIQAGNVVYQQEVGLANYESKKTFTKDSRFKINVSDLKKAGIIEFPELNGRSDKHLATGYLYHNYRGNGLELEAMAIPPIPGTQRSHVSLSTQELAQLIKTQVKDSVNFSGYLEHDGFSYAVNYKPTTQTAIIVLSNRRHPVADEIVNSMEAILEGRAYQLPLARKPYHINLTLLKDYVGKYTLNEQVKFEVVDNQDSLSVILGQNQVVLIPQSDNQFYMQETDAALRFKRDSTGMVDRVILLNGFMESDQIATKE